MKRNLLIIAVMLALGAITLSAKSKKSDVLDPQAFDNVHSYCTETADLPPQYLQIVQSFFNHQTKPKSVVNQLGWKKLDACGQADAIMKFEFSTTQEQNGAAPGGGGGFAPQGVNSASTTFFEVKAVVLDRATQKPICEVQGARAPDRGEEAMENTFKKLAKDLK